jgi:hypothetical protein
MLGPLHYLGGIEIRSTDRRFGGLSGLRLAADGSRFVAVADVGYWFTGRLVYDIAGRLIGMAEPSLEPLRDGSGRPFSGKGRRDAEDIADDGAGGFIVAFERHHRLLRYSRPGARGRPFAAPPGLEAAPENDGLEALTRLTDGRLLAITENFRSTDGATVRGWIGPAPWQPLTLRTSEGFVPTSLAGLPGGGALLIERRFPFLAIRLRRIAGADIRPAALLDPAEVARFEGSLTYDNFEAAAIRTGADGQPRLYLLSDDNQNPFQRTLLLSFALAAQD